MIYKETGIIETTFEQDPASSSNEQQTLCPPKSNGKSRRMKLLERQGCFHFGAKTVTIQRATTVEDLHAAYQLVHDCFAEGDKIFPKPSFLRMKSFQALPDTATFVAKADARIVGVTTVVTDTPGLGLPSEKIYSMEIGKLRQSARKICEITNLSIAPDHRRTVVLTELIRCYIAHLLAIGCEQAIASINPGHQAFYKLLGFETIGPVVLYMEKTHDPVVLVQLSLGNLLEKFAQAQIDCEESDIATLKHYYMDTNPYHAQIDQWNVQIQQAFADAVFLRRLFVEKSNLLTDCTADELMVIRDFWGDRVFLDTLGHHILCDMFSPFY